jgi:hypothetical protein
MGMRMMGLVVELVYRYERWEYDEEIGLGQGGYTRYGMQIRTWDIDDRLLDLVLEQCARS